MDKYTLRIAHFDMFEIQKLIESVKKIDRMNIELVSAQIEKPETYNLADIILVDINEGDQKIRKLFSSCAPYAEVVLLTHVERFINIDEYLEEHLENDLVDKFFDIWFYHDAILRYRITSFVKRMRNLFDAELAQKQLDVLMDSLPDLIWYKDIQGAHIKVNQAFCDTVKKTKEQIKDRGHCYIWDLNLEEYEQGEYVCMETEKVVIEEQKTFFFDEIVKIGDEMRQLKTYKSAILGRNGQTIGTVGFARDVTEIWNSREEFKSLISCLPTPIMIVDSKYNFVTCNDIFEELFHVSEKNKESFHIHTFGQFFFKEDIAFLEQQIATIECSVTLPNEKKIFFLIEKSPIKDVFNKISGYFYIFRNVTARYEYEQQLTVLSETDDLSQLSNRKGLRKIFDQILPSLRKSKKSLAIIIIDIDYFKKYNDEYGHLEGDNVIVAVSNILHGLQNENIYASRFGGEEFMLVVTEKSLEECEALMEEIQQELRIKNIPHEKSSVASYITLSLGLAYYGYITERISIQTVIDNADCALYDAKELGRNRYKIVFQNIAQ